jgi:heme-degrading monooxygenase HmoA
MIARIWRGVTSKNDEDKYYEYLEETGIKDYLATEGNRGVEVLKRDVRNGIEFTLISYWDSYDSIRNFAGDDVTKAVYYPEDDKYLIDRGSEIRHFEVLFNKRQ